MSLGDLLREGEQRRRVLLERKARAVHEGSTEHVRAKLNELHHVVGLTIDRELLAGTHGDLEREVLEAVNLSRDRADEAAGSDPLSRIGTGMLIDPDG